MVTVEGGTYGMDDSVLAVLAKQVRDQIPDLPFVAPNAGTSVPGSQDPCAVPRKMKPRRSSAGWWWFRTAREKVGR